MVVTDVVGASIGFLLHSGHPVASVDPAVEKPAIDFAVESAAAQPMQPAQQLPPCCSESSSLLRALPPKSCGGTAGSVVRGSLHSAAVDREVLVRSSHSMQSLS